MSQLQINPTYKWLALGCFVVIVLVVALVRGWI